MKYDKIIKGENIYLRNIELSDCKEKYVNWLNDPEVNKYLECRLSVQNIESITRFVLDVLESKDTYMFAIINKENKEHIGNTKIGPIHPIYKYTNFGLVIGEKKYWGSGLAIEAYYLTIKFCFDILNLHRVHDGVISPNEKAFKILERLGFKREGCRRDAIFQDGKYLDVYQYGILETEYRALN
jgi:RimJ/RimL family protein N-acetyltransferase